MRLIFCLLLPRPNLKHGICERLKWYEYHIKLVHIFVKNDKYMILRILLRTENYGQSDTIFKPLGNLRASEVILGKEKAKGSKKFGHDSWLRLYAIRFQCNSYLVTGGAIKLTRSMQEREHTLEELRKLEKVRNFLISEGAYDLDGFYDLMNK